MGSTCLPINESKQHYFVNTHSVYLFQYNIYGMLLTVAIVWLAFYIPLGKKGMWA